jgi:hypothetical protein
MSSHWVDNEAAHKAFMRRSCIEIFMMIALIVMVPLATAALIGLKVLHPSC